MRKRFFPLLLALILLLAGCGKRSRDNIHLLTRFSPDFTPYVGFLDTDYLLDESWYWVECETPATGVITRINLSDVKFSVEQTDAAGNHQERELSNSHTIISGATGSSHAFSTRYSDESITSEPLAKADYVSLHMPAQKGSPALFDEALIAKMKDGAFLINTARGALVDEAALIAALDSGKLAGAGIDVYQEEPSKNEALYTHPKVSVTPPVGGSTKEAQKRIGEEIVAHIQREFSL